MTALIRAERTLPEDSPDRVAVIGAKHVLEQVQTALLTVTERGQAPQASNWTRVVLEFPPEVHTALEKWAEVHSPGRDMTLVCADIIAHQLRRVHLL